jgi:hypothetical protein
MGFIPDQEKLLQGYEKRIIELRMALRWIREAAAFVHPDSAAETLTRIQQHAVVALLHDDDLTRPE